MQAVCQAIVNGVPWQPTEPTLSLGARRATSTIGAHLWNTLHVPVGLFKHRAKFHSIVAIKNGYLGAS